MGDLIASIVVRILNLIFRFIPISVSLWLGRAIGRAIFFFNRKRRVIGYANLKAAFGGEKSPAQLIQILKGVYVNIAQTFVEVLNLTKVSRKFVDRYVKVVNMERIKNAAKSGRGVILLTAHFGDWELSSLVGAIEGFPMTVLAREQKMKRLNELLNRLRESKGCKVVRKGISVKGILKALKNKEIVGILADQDAGKKGVFVDYFGRPTSVAPGAFEFASHTGAIILPNFIARLKGPYHSLFLDEYIEVSQSDVKASVQKYMNVLESYVRRYPDQWLWLHKRWKSTPVKTVLVLNDARPGHLNQSLAVADLIRKARTTQGYSLDDTKVAVLDVKFKNDFSKLLLSACSNLSSWRCHGCMRCLKACLEEGSYKNLMAAYADFVVSAGSNLAPVNAFMALENNAKNIVVMKQRNVHLNKFSLAIIQRHDNPRRRKNVVAVDIAPNSIDDERIRSESEILRKRLVLKANARIGLLIGGDNPDYTLTDGLINRVIDAASKTADELDAEILVTTSRRTPPKVEKILKERLSRNPRCRLLVIANEVNFKEAVAGILGLSDLVLVSGESISMVSEAISAGKRVAVFNLEKAVPALTKQDRAIKNFADSGYVTILPADELEEAMKGLLSSKAPIKKPKDMDVIYEAVRKLI